MRLKTKASTTWNSETGDEFWYAINNGYIILSDVLNKQDADKVRAAIDLLNELQELLLIDELG